MIIALLRSIGTRILLGNPLGLAQREVAQAEEQEQSTEGDHAQRNAELDGLGPIHEPAIARQRITVGPVGDCEGVSRVGKIDVGSRRA